MQEQMEPAKTKKELGQCPKAKTKKEPAKTKKESTDEETKQSKGRVDCVYECEVKIMYIPDVLDVDIVWALALAPEMPENSLEIFAKLPVKGIINGMWLGLCRKTFWVDFFMCIFECCAIVTWASVGTESWERALYLTRMEKLTFSYSVIVPLCNTVAIAAVCKDGVVITSWMYQYYAQGKQKKALSAKKDHGVVERYRSMWGFRNFYRNTDIRLTLLAWIVLLYLVYYRPNVEPKLVSLEYNTTNAVSPVRHDINDVNGQIVLAINILMYFFKVLWSFSAIGGVGEGVITLLKTTHSGVVIEMMLVCALFMSGVGVSFVTLLDNEHLGFVLINLYRGVIYGDGAGLDNLGLKADQSDALKWHKLLLAAGATFFFNIVILNLIIAVYGNEYDRLATISSLHFWRQRARIDTRYYLTQEIWNHERLKWVCRTKYLHLFSLGLIFLGLLLSGGLRFWYWWFTKTPINRNPSIYKNYISIVVCAVLLAIGELLLLAWTSVGNWIDAEEDDGNTGVTGKGKEKFLWICHRADFTDNFKGRDNATRADLTRDCCSKEKVEEVKKQIRKILDEATGDNDHTARENIKCLIEDVDKINKFLNTRF